MTHLIGQDRSQTLLLPESLDDYVGPENPVRFIEAFVAGLDLGAAGFGRVRPKETGRPGYMPADLLKLYIYGYLNRVRSSRRLEAEIHHNIEVIWLLRHLKPDFKNDSRRDNRNAFRERSTMGEIQSSVDIPHPSRIVPQISSTSEPVEANCQDDWSVRRTVPRASSTGWRLSVGCACRPPDPVAQLPPCPLRRKLSAGSIFSKGAL